MDFTPEKLFILCLGVAFVITVISVVFRFAKADQAARREHQLRKQREQTYSEIAAYVAEGTISPADAERMMRAMGDITEADKVKFDVQAARMRG